MLFEPQEKIQNTFIPLNEKDGVHEDSAQAAAAQPKLQWPYHLADQKLFVF